MKKDNTWEAVDDLIWYPIRVSVRVSTARLFEHSALKATVDSIYRLVGRPSKDSILDSGLRSIWRSIKEAANE